MNNHRRIQKAQNGDQSLISVEQELLKARGDLTSSETLLWAVNNVAMILLEGEDEDPDHVIELCLQTLGESIQADSVFMWRNFESENKDLCATQVAEWRRDQTAGNLDEKIHIVFKQHIPQWDQGQTNRAEISLSHVRAGEEPMGMPLPEDVKSAFLLPLTMQGSFWGFIGFDYETEETAQHITTEKEKSILKSGGLLIASAIVRNEMKENLTKAESLAYLDALTQIENRGSFMSRAGALFNQQKAAGEKVSVLFLDIDHFKDVNDRYGHSFGDQVLAQCAHVLREEIRPEDKVCRYGGEEFVVLLPGVGEHAGVRVGKRIAEALRALVFEENPEYTITVSIGVASGVPQEHEGLENYIKYSDEAMYQVKTSGRDALAVYDARNTYAE